MYHLRASWSGDSGYEGSLSPTSTLQVTPANTLLDTSLSENAIHAGSSVNVTATMVPALQGKSVIIEYSYDNSTWFYLNLGNTDWNGQYSYSWSPDIGACYLRSQWTGDANYSGTISDSQYLNVTEATQHYLNVYSPFGTVSGMGWYDIGTNVTATLTDKTYDVIPGSVKAVFTGWSGDAVGTGLISDPITMDGPKTAIATWVIKLSGDVDGNGIVDINDAILASHAFGSSIGELHWNVEVDMNGDNVIDIFDMILMCRNFGRTLATYM
jgi:hypothetical protein